jgi:hypothetical protein
MDRSRTISQKRDTAERSRRLAHGLSSLDDRANLLGFAQELDDEVARLERESRPNLSGALQA